mgnify:CR=1 FL=1
MAKELLAPDYIFEASWEVCNKVGGIYTVLSTRAKTLQEAFKDKVFFIGPDFWAGKENPLFSENENLCAAWREHALKKDGLKFVWGAGIFRESYHYMVDFILSSLKEMNIWPDVGEISSRFTSCLMEITTKRLCFLMQPEKWLKAFIVSI